MNKQEEKSQTESKKSVLDIAQLICAIIAILISCISIWWTIKTNNTQDEQWEKSFNAQNHEIALTQIAVEKLDAQSKSQAESAEELRKQNELLISSQVKLEEQNHILKSSLEEQKTQNDIIRNGIKFQLSEKDIMCRIGYLCCEYDSLWPLLNAVGEDKLLVVNNELTELLDLHHIENSNPYDYSENYYKLRKNMGQQNNPIIIMLKIDLLSNCTILTQDLTLNSTEVSFQETLPTALSQLSMYSTLLGEDHLGNLVDISQYQCDKEKFTYSFSDQFIGSDQCTTILCPVMIQAKPAKNVSDKDLGMLVPCTTTYQVINIPDSITFTDISSNKKTIEIRDLNDYESITEYKNIYGLG